MSPSPMYAELSPDNQDNSSVEKDLKDTVAQSRALPNGVEVEKAWATSFHKNLKPRSDSRSSFALVFASLHLAPLEPRRLLPRSI